MVNSPADLYRLGMVKLANLDRMADKSAANIGQLSVVPAVAREREAVNAGQMQSTAPAGLPMAVQSARKTYQAEVARITSADAVMQQRMAADYLRVLSSLQPRAATNIELARQLAAEKAKVQENRPRPDNVPPDACRFNGKWYRLYAEQCSWKTARDRCTRAGGQLAIIPDEATQVFIRSLTTDAPSWLGAHNVKGNRGWQWVDGTPMTFTAWGENQPDNWGGNQHYLQIIKGFWDDTEEDRDDIYSYLCEWKGR